MVIYLISICIGIVTFCIILCSLFSYGQRKDHIKKRLKSIERACEVGLAQEDEFNKSLYDRLIKPSIDKGINRLKKYIPIESNNMSFYTNKNQEKFKELIYKSGISLSVSQYMRLRVVMIFFSGVLFLTIALVLQLEVPIVFFLTIMGIYGAYAILRFDLSRRITSRSNNMQRQLPEVLDMLSISVEAGLGLEQAMLEVVDHFDGPLITELSITNREMAMGRRRKEALLLIGDRCDIEEIKTFVRAIVQAGQLGISIKNVLRAQAMFMRQTRKNKIEERAMKVPVKILLPMAFFIFPVIFIVLLGPAVVQIAEKLL